MFLNQGDFMKSIDRREFATHLDGGNDLIGGSRANFAFQLEGAESLAIAASDLG